MSNVIYYGCWDECGHFPWETGKERLSFRDFFNLQPWGSRVDGGLCHLGKERQGVYRVHKQDGWTAVAFWDRSVDHRPGSNSVFLIQQDVSGAELLRMAHEQFPSVFARFTFDLVPEVQP